MSCGCKKRRLNEKRVKELLLNKQPPPKIRLTEIAKKKQ